MVRRCQCYCTGAYSEIVQKSITGVKYKHIWRYCGMCQIFIKIKAWLCPCCRCTLAKIKNSFSNIPRFKVYYERHRDKILEKRRQYYQKNKEIINLKKRLRRKKQNGL